MLKNAKTIKLGPHLDMPPAVQSFTNIAPICIIVKSKNDKNDEIFLHANLFLAFFHRFELVSNGGKEYW